MENQERKEFAEKVLTYYRSHRRVLPWREHPLPYYVWLSEIMLQQTRVETVIPYFERFVKKFPTIKDLAKGEEEDLMKLWEGLGYYSRARNLQKAAKEIVRNYDGSLPSSKKELMSLPGIGPYTAGAIASIAFGNRETAVDGNLIRVASRILSYGDSVTKVSGKKIIEHFWQEVLPQKNAGDFNQAIMDIGSTICLPNGTPRCELCPISSHCRAYQNGNPMDYPKREEKKPRRIEEKTVWILYRDEEIAFEKRERDGLLAEMWQFPMAEGHLDEEEARAWLLERDFFAIRMVKGPVAKHVFSHIEWKMVSWKVFLDNISVNEHSTDDFSWFSKQEMDEITLPTAFRKFREEVRTKEGQSRFEG